MNVGGTPRSVEIYAFVPSIDPTSVEVQLEKGVLTIAGERKPELPAQDAKTTVHSDERFSGRLRRVVTLPDDIDPNTVKAGPKQHCVALAAGVVAGSARCRFGLWHKHRSGSHC